MCIVGKRTTMKQRTITTDILVIGSGVAGISFALRIAPYHSVLLATKGMLTESSTLYAQGGIASVASEEDSFLSHIQDTLTAGAGLCHADVVESVVNAGPELIADLIHWGVKFTRVEDDRTRYHLTREGGHATRRIYHADDTTGREVERKLAATVRREKRITVYEQCMAINLIVHTQANTTTCYGAYLLDTKTGRVVTVKARVVVLATGGAGKVYVYTSNPDVSTGDGIAMAYRAGAAIRNMEFFQFHPTCLYHPHATTMLISEAVRGEGGKLLLPTHKPFMQKYHPLGDLAPRDVVARAMDAEMKIHGLSCVYLDISHKPKQFILHRFPHIYRTCKDLGIDITREPIPVVPAAHYLCGGVQTDLYARTTVNNLFAVGETACTGLHGANRLASNSLLEALFFAHQAAGFLKDNFPARHFPKIPSWDIGKAVDSNEQIMINHNWYEIRRLMWNYVGIVRSDKRLARAKRRIELLKKEIHEYYWDFIVTAPLLELRNLATVADLIIASAQKRKESRGLHYSLDYPKTLPVAKDTTIQKNN